MWGIGSRQGPPISLGIGFIEMVMPGKPLKGKEEIAWWSRRCVTGQVKEKVYLKAQRSERLCGVFTRLLESGRR